MMEVVIAENTTLEKEKRTVEKQLLKEEHSITPLDKAQVIYFLEKFTNGDIEDFDFRRRITDILVNKVWVFDKPDGDTELEIAFNLTNEPKRKINLKDIKSVKSSYVEDCVPPSSGYKKDVSPKNLGNTEVFCCL